MSERDKLAKLDALTPQDTWVAFTESQLAGTIATQSGQPIAACYDVSFTGEQHPRPDTAKFIAELVGAFRRGELVLSALTPAPVAEPAAVQEAARVLLERLENQSLPKEVWDEFMAGFPTNALRALSQKPDCIHMTAEMAKNCPTCNPPTIAPAPVADPKHICELNVLFNGECSVCGSRPEKQQPSTVSDPASVKRSDVYAALRSYTMSNMSFKDEPANPYPLVDLMSNDGDTIESGEREMELLADHIASELSTAPVADPVAEAARVSPIYDLLPDAVSRAEKAMRKFPQPNYVISKWAEESGEVTKALIHAAEGRETWENVRGEIVDTLAMLHRLMVEGDEVHGLPALRALSQEGK